VRLCEQRPFLPRFNARHVALKSPSRRPHSVVRGSLISWTLIESLRSAVYVADEGRLRCMRSAVLLCILFLQEKHKLLRPWRHMQQLGRFGDGTFLCQLGLGAVSLHATHCSINTLRCSGFRGLLSAKSVFQFLINASQQVTLPLLYTKTRGR
jgi:hypothetical protein